MRLTELLDPLPPVRHIDGARHKIAARLADSRNRLIVVDDDPTGTQTVHGVQVYMDWATETLRRAMVSANATSFVSANTRALDENDVKKLAYEIGRNIRAAGDREHVNVLVASRSDSTLRGHFPCEVESLARGLGWECDGVILAPALFDAGRYTVGDMHWVDLGDQVVLAGETEFARDPTFAYQNSNLKHWVEEKTHGKVSAGEVVSVSVDEIRLGGPDAVAGKLASVAESTVVVVNAACYEDLEIFVLGLLAAEERGKRFIYRCAAPFVKVRGGIDDRPLLTAHDLAREPGPGLVVIGSYVAKTSRQLDALLNSGLACGVELRIERLLEESTRTREVTRLIEWVDGRLSSGESAAVYTSRDVLDRGGDFLGVGKLIVASLCEVVAGLRVRPSFVLAKGGITSTEVARSGLGVSGASVLGQVLPAVSVWRLGPEARWPGVPYIVFPGNVGDDESVLDAVKILLGLPAK